MQYRLIIGVENGCVIKQSRKEQFALGTSFSREWAFAAVARTEIPRDALLTTKTFVAALRRRVASAGA